MRLADLSVSGCFVDTLTLYPRGARVTLYATLVDKEVTLTGRVIHVQPGRGFGFAIQFEDLPADTRQQLEHFLTAQS